MKKSLPSNRVAALAAGLTGLATMGTALAGVWPGKITDHIATICGASLVGIPAITHMIGNMFWERTPAGQAKYLPSMAPPEPLPAANIGTSSTGSTMTVFYEPTEGDPEEEPLPEYLTEPYPEGQADQAPEHHPRIGDPDAPEPPAANEV